MPDVLKNKNSDIISGLLLASAIIGSEKIDRYPKKKDRESRNQPPASDYFGQLAINEVPARSRAS
jgi:hypothetical protein